MSDTSSDPSTLAAVDAARILAARFGIDSSPRVIADRSHLVLEMTPAPIVARVALSTSLTRIGLQWLMREVEIARHLDAAGVPVTRPVVTFDPGPHVHGDLIVSFWQLEIHASALDAAAAGRRLADAHRALATFDPTRVPEWGVIDEARTLLPRACDNGILTQSEARRLTAGWERAEALVASARARTVSFQAVHGDAHFGNVFATERGPLWTDWEDACVAPVEWDLATLAARHELFGEESEWLRLALDTYDLEVDRTLVRELIPLRNLQVIPWLVVFAERQPDLAGRARARLAHVED